MYLRGTELEMNVIEDTLTINTELLGREVICTLFIPEDLHTSEPINLLLLNDGQEAENLHLKDTLENLYAANRIRPLIVAAIAAGDDRIQEYGIAGKPDFKKRGSKADVYTKFVLEELLPEIKAHLEIEKFGITAIAGFSLGGLTALDIAWNHPGIFDKTGVFSGSLWWRGKDLGQGYSDEDRLMHQEIRTTPGKPDLKFWLQTGTRDETADRNKNGIIDAIDDTVDLIKELEAKGYTRNEDIQYLEMVGGEHNVTTWAKAMPKFLCWAFGA